MPIACQRHLFDIPDEVAYLNCAYMSPLLNRVVEVGQQAAAVKSQPWRISPPDFFATPERARVLFAELIGAQSDDIAVIPAASYGIATAAANLPLQRGHQVIVLADQFPSNVYAWRELAERRQAQVKTIAWPEDGDWTRVLLAAINEQTDIVALPHCHWTDGSLIDLVAIGRRCREVKAALVLDLTQSIGALPFDVREVQPDYLIAAGYKWMMGPYTLGFMYIAPEHCDGAPLEHNWIARQGSQDFARLVDYQMKFQPGARRFDMGEGAYFGQMPMAVAALEQLLQWGVGNIQDSLRRFTDGIAAQAADLGLQTGQRHLRAGHFLGLRFPAGVPEGILAQLAKEQVFVSVRGDALRVTPHLYNNKLDADKLMAVLAKALESQH